jgi:hypothetical protein
MKSALRFVTLAGLVLATSPVRACPFCVTETGRRVREGLFGPEFGPNLAAILLPFLICVGVVAGIHPGVTSPAGGLDREPGHRGAGDGPHPVAGDRERVEALS